MIDFSDLEHGLGVLRTALAEQDPGLAAHCLALLAQDTATATGSAAAEFHLLLGRARLDGLTPGRVDEIDAAFARLVVAYAASHEIEGEKRHRRHQEAGRKGRQGRVLDESTKARWRVLAARIRKDRPDLEWWEIAQGIAAQHQRLTGESWAVKTVNNVITKKV